VLDPGSGFCLGCGRSLDEIAEWSNLGAEARNRIMAELPQRMKKIRPD
jgi:predicted Fe-S protein YdhL (DUF1289 family)